MLRADAIDLLVRVATVLFPQDRQFFCQLPKNRVFVSYGSASGRTSQAPQARWNFSDNLISIMQCNSNLRSARKTRVFPSDCACLAVAGDAFLTISYIRLMFKLAQNHVDFKLYCILHRLFSTVISGASCLLSASLNFSLCFKICVFEKIQNKIME